MLFRVGSSSRKIIYSNLILLALAISLTSVIALLLAFVYLRDWIGVGYDDSYITFRYAQNLINTLEYRFNNNSNANSASPLLFGFLLAILGSIRILTIPQLAVLLNVVGLIGMVTGISLWSLSENKRLIPTLSALFLGVSITSSGFIGYWMLSGMETIFCAGLLTICLYIFKKHFAQAAAGNTKSIVSISSILVLLGFARLELNLVAIALGIYFLFVSFVVNQKIEFLSFWSRLKVASVPLLSALFVLIITLLFFKLYYENVLPDPVRFKNLVNYYISDVNSQWQISKTFVLTYFGYTGFVASISILLLLFNFRRSIDSFASLLPLVAFVALIPSVLKSPNSDFYRYQVFFIPLIGIMASSVFKTLNRKKLVFILVVVLLFFTYKSISAGLSGYTTMRDIALADRSIQSDRAIVGEWLEQNTPYGSIVWSGDLGSISFNNPSNQYFDGGGLTNRLIIDAVENGADYSAVLCETRPTYIADSIDIATDLPSVVWILDNLSSYYSAETGKAITSRNSKELFTLSKLFSASGNGAIGIGVYKVNWFGC